MPVYKGTSEITSGNFYKGSTSIENGYKQTDSFFVNLVTIEFSSISGQGFAYTLPVSQTGDPGSSYPSTTFTISGASNERLNGSAFSITGLPSSLSASVTSGNNTNTLTVTITGNYPTIGVGPIDAVVSGITAVTSYLAHFLLVGGGGNAGSGYVASGAGGGGVRTSFSPNGGGQSVDSRPTLVPNTTYTITVAGVGGNSTFNGITATRGNNGSGSTADARGGGSAGSYGYSGGGASSSFGAGGGGGAGGNGGSVSNGGGNGGAPVVNSITGSPTNYGSGGRGYTGNYGAGSSTPSAYGKGGDGSGGGGQPGVVILRVPTASVGTPSGHSSTNTVGSDTVIKWTSSGSYTG
jgi:hypothetical protein